jgi:hypothetical protein
VDHRKRTLVLGVAVASLLLGHRPARGGDALGGGARDAEEFLDKLVGDWQISRKIRGRVEGNRLEAKWILQHRFVQLRMTDVETPPRYEAQILVGFEEKMNRFVAYWCDSYGPDVAAVGHGEKRGNAIEFNFAYPEGPFYNTFTWDPAAGGWTFLMESEKEGRRVLFALDSATKR